MHYLIDGYNVIFHCGVLTKLAKRDLDVARDALIGDVAAFCWATDQRATLIFDGQCQTFPERRAPAPHDPVEVIFASKRHSADALIERKVYEAKDRMGIAVVTADRGVRDLCRGLGSLVIDPELFLQEARQAARRQLASPKSEGHGHQLHSVEARLAAAARARLHELRKRLRSI